MRVASVASNRRTSLLQRKQAQQRHQRWWPSAASPLSLGIAAVLLFLLQLTANVAIVVAAEDATTLYVLDKDTRDDCSERFHECQTSATDRRFFLQCPITCAKALAQEGGIGRTTKDPEEFFYPQVVTTVEGNEIAMEDLVDGYVTLFAMIPMLHPDSGMAQYYYELLEHVAALYKYTLQVFVVPIRMGHAPLAVSLIQPHAKSSSSSSSSSSPKSPQQERRVIVLQETTLQELPSFLSDFIFESKPIAGDSVHMGHVAFDKVSIYLLSADAEFVERLVSPTMTILEERIPVYVNQLSARADL